MKLNEILTKQCVNYFSLDVNESLIISFLHLSGTLGCKFQGISIYKIQFSKKPSLKSWIKFVQS